MTTTRETVASYAQIWQSICTSEPLRASTRVFQREETDCFEDCPKVLQSTPIFHVKVTNFQLRTPLPPPAFRFAQICSGSAMFGDSGRLGGLKARSKGISIYLYHTILAQPPLMVG